MTDRLPRRAEWLEERSLMTVTVTVATGGTNISADKAANSTTPAFTTLGNIRIDEGADEDFAASQSGTLVFHAPTNWEFDTVTPVITIETPAGQSDFLATPTVVMTSSTMTITFQTDSDANKDDFLQIAGLRVRALNGAIIPSTGNILVTGTFSIVGIVENVTNFGTLSQVVGAPTKLNFGQQPTNVQANDPIDPAVTVRVEDQFSNLVTSSSANVTMTIGANPGGSTLSGTTLVTASSGVATFSNLSLNNTANGYTLHATSPSLTEVFSGTFNVDGAGPITSNVLVTPVASSTPPTVTADISDIPTGNSNIAAAEYFIDAVGVEGTGTALAGSFGNPTVSVSATLSALEFGALSEGSHTVYVRGRDHLGNWGGTASNMFIKDVTAPGTPTDSNTGAANEVAENSPVDTPVGVTVNSSDISTVTYSLDNNAGGRFKINSSTGVVTTGLTNIDREVDGPTLTFVAKATDGAGNSSTQTFTVAVLPVNEFSPTITSGNSASVPENTSTGTVVLDANATDADLPSPTLTFSLGGTDAARFNINPSSGEITFAASPNYESPIDANADNVYEITVTASDGSLSSAPQSVSITVTPVNEFAPTITSGNSASPPENTATSAVVLDVNATDADLPAQTLTYAISGTDAGDFTIDSATGEIRFSSSPNFEAPADDNADNVYEISVSASDGSLTSSPQSVTITVTPVNEFAPAITSGDSASVPENTSTGTVVLDANASDADLPTPTFTFSLGGTDAAQFNINASTGEIKFASSPNYEAPTDANSDNVYEITVTASDGSMSSAPQSVSITVTPVNEFAPSITSGTSSNTPENTGTSVVVHDVNATDADLPSQTLTYAIGGTDAGDFTIDPATGEIKFAAVPDYESPADANADNVYEITVTASDGSLTSSPQNVTISVTPVNDNNPSFTSSATPSVPENTTAVVDVDATDADQPAQTLTYSISGGADQGKFSINASSGVLTFDSAPDYENPTDADTNNTYLVQVTANDGNGGTTTQDLTVTVTPENDNNPSFTSSATPSVPENSTTAVDVDATDADLPAQTLTYSISGGADQSKFSIDASSGLLTFNTPPDFENPTDVGANNVYEVQVTANDGAGGTTVQDISVTVTDVAESPIRILYQIIDATHVDVTKVYDTYSDPVEHLSGGTIETGYTAPEIVVQYPAAGTFGIGAFAIFQDVGGSDGRLLVNDIFLPDIVLKVAGVTSLEFDGNVNPDYFLAFAMDNQFTGTLRFHTNGGADLVSGILLNVNQEMQGGEGADVLLSGYGNDTLTGGAGTDVVFGGLGGVDTVVESVVRSAKVTGARSLNAAAISQAVRGAGANAGLVAAALLGVPKSGAAAQLTANGTDSLQGIDEIVLIGSDGPDVINASGYAGPVRIEGRGGDDTITGSSGNDIIDGGDGNDLINGGAGNDIINGGAGNDTINGGLGRDLLIGGLGSDKLNGNETDDILIADGVNVSADTLQKIRTEWAGSGTAAQRRTRLLNGTGTTGAKLSVAQIVADASAANVLNGNAGGNWLLAKSSDQVFRTNADFLDVI